MNILTKVATNLHFTISNLSSFSITYYGPSIIAYDDMLTGFEFLFEEIMLLNILRSMLSIEKLRAPKLATVTFFSGILFFKGDHNILRL